MYWALYYGKIKRQMHIYECYPGPRGFFFILYWQILQREPLLIYFFSRRKFPNKWKKIILKESLWDQGIWVWARYRVFSNYWMRPSRIWRILQIKEGVIHRGRRPRSITPSEICRILHILRKPNSIIALLFIQNISSFLKEFRHYALCFSAHQI